MKKLLALLVLLAAPVAAQTPAQLDSLRADMVRWRAANRQAETYGTRVIDALDRYRAATPPPVTPPVTPPADTTTTPPPSGGFAMPNRPAGLVTTHDCDFTAAWAGNDGTMPCAVGSIGVTDWNRGGRPNDQCRTINDPTALDGRSWESHYDDGPGGSGPCALDISLGGSRDTVYFAVRVKYGAGWQSNTNSQKIAYFNTTQGEHVDLLEYRYGVEAVSNVTSATGCEALESNVASVAVKSPPESSPCQGQRATYLTAGSWHTYELLWIARSGTVRWWKDGQPRGSHTGRNIGRMTGFQLPDTWGGGGTLTQEQSRYYDRIVVARSAN